MWVGAGPTGGAGPLRRPGDEALLPAGRLQPVALVLVGVAVGAAHGHVVFVTLQSTDGSGSKVRPSQGNRSRDRSHDLPGTDRRI